MAAMGSRGDIYKANQTLIGERNTTVEHNFQICFKSREQRERRHRNNNERGRSKAKEQQLDAGEILEFLDGNLSKLYSKTSSAELQFDMIQCRRET